MDDWKPECPVLNEKANHGLLGDIVRAFAPTTEAAPPAISSQLLACCGNLIGNNANYLIGKTRHHTALNVVIVGKTSKARKGTAFDLVHPILGEVDPIWAKNNLATGLSSGEGVVWAVRDPIVEADPTSPSGTKIIDPGVADKRLLIYTQELGETLGVMKRIGNTLSAVIRMAWDGTKPLGTLTKNSRARATGYHISIIAHITQEELVRTFDEGLGWNGFGNRFLWFFVKRTGLLPNGGQIDTAIYNSLVERLRAVVNFARAAGELRMTPDAMALWCAIYKDLAEGKPGFIGSMTSRSEPMVIRLAMLYALLDCTTDIRPEHLTAAYAVWKFSEESVDFIFGYHDTNRVAVRILDALREVTPQGLTLTQLHELFHHHLSRDKMSTSLDQLSARNLAYKVVTKTSGRPFEKWFFREPEPR
jgi:hypothetical protein